MSDDIQADHPFIHHVRAGELVSGDPSLTMRQSRLRDFEMCEADSIRGESLSSRIALKPADKKAWGLSGFTPVKQGGSDASQWYVRVVVVSV